MEDSDVMHPEMMVAGAKVVLDLEARIGAEAARDLAVDVYYAMRDALRELHETAEANRKAKK